VTKPAAQHAQDQKETTQGTATAVAVVIVVPLVLAVGVLGGIGSFASIRHLAQPWFGGSAWTVPVGIDVGIIALLAWDAGWFSGTSPATTTDSPLSTSAC